MPLLAGQDLPVHGAGESPDEVLTLTADLTGVDTVKLVRDDDAARVEEVTRRSSFSTYRSRTS